MKIRARRTPQTKGSLGYHKLPECAADHLHCLLWHILALKEVKLALAFPSRKCCNALYDTCF